MRRSTVVALFALTMLVGNASRAAASLCAVMLPIDHAALADVVFVGTLVEADRSAAAPRVVPYTALHRYDVERTIRGTVARTVEVAYSEGYVLPPEVRGRYTIFASLIDGQLVANTCATHRGDPDPSVLLFGGLVDDDARRRAPLEVVAPAVIAAIVASFAGSRRSVRA